MAGNLYPSSKTRTRSLTAKTLKDCAVTTELFNKIIIPKHATEFINYEGNEKDFFISLNFVYELFNISFWLSGLREPLSVKTDTYLNLIS